MSQKTATKLTRIARVRSCPAVQSIVRILTRLRVRLEAVCNFLLALDEREQQSRIEWRVALAAADHGGRVELAV